MSVEFIIAAPMLVMLLLLIAFAGQWFNNTNQVGAAARDAARTASNIVHWPDVQSAATAAAAADLTGVCSGVPTVTIDQLTVGRLGDGGVRSKRREVLRRAAVHVQSADRRHRVTHLHRRRLRPARSLLVPDQLMIARL